RAPGWRRTSVVLEASAGRTPATPLAEAHLLADLGHRLCGYGCDTVCARREDLVDPSRIGLELEVALPCARVVAHDPIREQPLHVDATGPCRALAVPQVLVVIAEETLQLADVADLRAARVRTQDPLRVGDHRHDLLADELRLREHVDRVADRLRHLPDT